MLTLEIGRKSKSPTPSPAQLCCFFFFSSSSSTPWYSPPLPHQEDPILTTLSQAIRSSQTKPLHISLKKLLPSLTPSHVINLITLNPHSLSPLSLLSFFNFLSSHPPFRHTLRSYSTMAHFLIAHKMFHQAQSLLHFLVSRKGKGSASLVFTSIIETKGTHQCGFVFDSLMIAYKDLGFVPDAIQCFRVSQIKDAQMVFNEIGKRGLRATVVSFNTLINGYCKSGNLGEGFRLKRAMEDSGIRPDVFTYSVLINGLCKESRLDDANGLFEEMCNRGEGRLIDAERTLREMLSAGMKPDDATYTMVIDGFCKNGNVKMGFKLLKEMQSDGHVPGVITYNVLMNGLCKLGQMKNANMLLDAMIGLGVVPDDITYNILLDGHCKKGNPKDFNRLKSEMGLVADYASYKSLISQIGRSSKHSPKLVEKSSLSLGIVYVNQIMNLGDNQASIRWATGVLRVQCDCLDPRAKLSRRSLKPKCLNKKPFIEEDPFVSLESLRTSSFTWITTHYSDGTV
ncbi:hypothetical protein POUND7_020514 [Theobroma cacao]